MWNNVVTAINSFLLDQLKGTAELYNSINTVDVNNIIKGQDELPLEFLQNLNSAGLPPAILILKVDTPIILL